ncbi:hypothetical protein [Companilactobacillus mishanensis]|uniref:hypothetical protein n=1 Tax=Companilactobacillus mishanensis TaxID=2486008 RepID=UPI001297EBF0|nr:hypothetical protein [Companilactobacillus mishanensis]MQS89593.1 hypothetical protein [Companilactobacillus mishanensis]
MKQSYTAKQAKKHFRKVLSDVDKSGKPIFIKDPKNRENNAVIISKEKYVEIFNTINKSMPSSRLMEKYGNDQNNKMPEGQREFDWGLDVGKERFDEESDTMSTANKLYKKHEKLMKRLEDL